MTLWVRLAVLSISTRGSTWNTSARFGRLRRPASAFSSQISPRSAFSILSRMRPSRACVGHGEPGDRVLEAQRVQRHAVDGGEDVRVDDADARQRQGTRHLHEQAGMVGGVEQHLGARAELVDAEVDRQRRPLGVGPPDDPGVAQMLLGRKPSQ